MIRRAALLAPVFLSLAGCTERAPEPRPDWVLHSRVVFRADDRGTPRDPPPRGSFRMTFPIIAGDLYGSPDSGGFIDAQVGDDFGIVVDLNAGHAGLVSTLEPTEFGVLRLEITPHDARLARIAPAALETDGIERIGQTDWVDLSTGESLMLVYFDRPAALTGHFAGRGGTVTFDVQVPMPGYTWIREQQAADGAIRYVATDPPRDPVLAVRIPAEAAG